MSKTKPYWETFPWKDHCSFPQPKYLNRWVKIGNPKNMSPCWLLEMCMHGWELREFPLVIVWGLRMFLIHVQVGGPFFCIQASSLQLPKHRANGPWTKRSHWSHKFLATGLQTSSCLHWTRETRSWIQPLWKNSNMGWRINECHYMTRVLPAVFLDVVKTVINPGTCRKQISSTRAWVIWVVE